MASIEFLFGSPKKKLIISEKTNCINVRSYDGAKEIARILKLIRNLEITSYWKAFMNEIKRIVIEIRYIAW